MEKGRARIEPPDLSEKGGLKDGQPQRSDERLFMQLLAFGDCDDSGAVARQLAQAGIDGALYEDVNDPHGIAVLSPGRGHKAKIERKHRPGREDAGQLESPELPCEFELVTAALGRLDDYV